MRRTYISDNSEYFDHSTPDPATTANVPKTSNGLNKSPMLSNKLSNIPSKILPRNKEIRAIPKLPHNSHQ